MYQWVQIVQPTPSILMDLNPPQTTGPAATQSYKQRGASCNDMPATHLLRSFVGDISTYYSIQTCQPDVLASVLKH